MVVKGLGQSWPGGGGGLNHGVGSSGEGLAVSSKSVGYKIKIMTLVILTKVENAKVLTKTFKRRFYFFSFCSQS
jgi:hypothetical protein